MPIRTTATGALIATMLLAALLTATPVLVHAQAISSGGRAPSHDATGADSGARTPWGDPDLQGTWTTDAAYSIPLQRPAKFGTRAELTDQEYKEKATRVSRRQSDAARGGSGSIAARSQDARWMTRTFRQTSLIVDPPDGRFPALTPAAQKAAASAPMGTYGNGPLNGPEDFNLYERCITLGVVGSMLPKIYGNGHRIVQAPGFVAITNEMVHETRIVPLDGRAHRSAAMTSYMGDSRGRFEGSSLVVETTNFNGRGNFFGMGNLSGVHARLVERFTRVEAEVMRYEVTITDPETFTRPVTIRIPLTSPGGYQVLPYDCHEGNYALLQALGAERAEDRALEADRKKGINRPRRPVQDGLGIGGSLASERIPELEAEPEP
jgi:hypothetical protein